MNRLRHAWDLLSLYLRSVAAAAHARRSGAMGMEFDAYGRKLGWRLLQRKCRLGIDYLLNPVSSTRYFEFPAVYEWMPDVPDRVLDVSSPRLFSLYFAEHHPQSRVRVINPDSRDAEITVQVAQTLGVANLEVEVGDASVLGADGAAYDCIWCISVVEHVCGEYDDSRAMQLMYEALAPGGRLLVTFPVDREHWDEYRAIDTYGLGVEATSGGRYFFQRFYNLASIGERLLEPIGVAADCATMRWYGERFPGRFHEYISAWMERGVACTASDAREMSDNYTEYESWDSMPGVGVCALLITKVV